MFTQSEQSSGSFLGKIFDVSDFPARWNCGNWTPFHGWLHIISDTLVFGAYMTIPIVIILYARKRDDILFPKIFLLFAGFIFFCGITHLTDAILFWYPFYRFDGLAKLATALVSWATVLGLIKMLPRALELPSQVASEKKFRSLFNDSPYAIIGVDSNGTITLVNSTAKRLFGYFSEEIEGKNFEMLIPSRFRHGHSSLFKKFLEAPQVRDMAKNRELFALNKEGAEFPVEIALNPVNIGNDSFVLATITDISERKKAETDLKKSEERMRCMSEISAEMDSSNLEKMNKMLKQATPMLGMDVGIVSKISGKEYKVISVYDEAQNVNPGRIFDIGETYCNLTLERKDVVDLHHMEKSIYSGHPCFSKFQLQSYIGIPIYLNNQIYGTLNFSRTAPRETPFKDMDKEFVRVMSRWISNLISSENFREELLESQERHSFVLDAISAGVWEWLDINTSKTYWSPKFYHLLGYRDGELEASHDLLINKLLHPDDRERTEKAIQAHLNGEGLFELEYRLRNKQGIYRWFKVSAVLKTNDAGKPQGMIGSIQDITEEWENRNRLKEITDELTRSNEELGHIAYVASHDLQEPLRTITNYLQLIEQELGDDLKEDIKEFFDYTTDAAKRMRSLILALLEYSRLNSALSKLEKVDTHFSITSVVQNLEERINETDAKIEYSEEMPKVYGNENLLTELFQNLISNALKFKRDDVAPIIQVKFKDYEQDRNYIQFTVKDNGLGIRADYLNKIFEMFKRFHPKSKYSGSGIGLSTVKKIVEKHEGNIWVESAVGLGTQFHFTLKKYK